MRDKINLQRSYKLKLYGNYTKVDIARYTSTKYKEYINYIQNKYDC